jgi:hypothetical protein
MSKRVLMIVAVLLILMGVATLIPRWTFASGASWYGIAQIVLGVVAFGFAYANKK